jgi:Rrf2 family protein
MQLTQATDYGFRTVQHLASLEPGKVATAQSIAEKEEIPLRFLLKLMRSLIKAGIVKSHRGVEGGYGLARSAADISLLDVVEAIEGPVRISRCLVSAEYCNRNYTKFCPVHHVLGDLQVVVVNKLSKVSFADLISGKRGG